MNKKEIRWKPPERNWIKINFDSALKGNLGESGARMVVKNANGEIITFARKKLRNGTNNMAEEQAACLAVQLGKTLGVDNIHLEGDSKVIVD